MGVTAMPQSAEPICYRPDVFDVGSEEEARSIILQAEDAAQVERRWEIETPWFGDLIVRGCGVTAESRILDFGCGLGRLSRRIIETTGCSVTGIDISPSMRELAAGYVASPRFSTAAYEDFIAAPGLGGGFDGAFACYVLQHVERPDRDLPAIASSLRPGGRFVLVNSLTRWVPTSHGWAQDGFDVLGIAGTLFDLVEAPVFPPEIAALPGLDRETVIRVYRRR
jgi:SAM-dependent methyltransferase